MGDVRIRPEANIDHDKPDGSKRDRSWTLQAPLDRGGNVQGIAPPREAGDSRWTTEAWRVAVGAVDYAEHDDLAIGEIVYRFGVNDVGSIRRTIERHRADGTRPHVILEDPVVLPGCDVMLGVRF
jgi:hypothetical protein